MDEERYPALPWQGWKIVKRLGRGGVSGTAEFGGCHGRCCCKGDFFPKK